MHIHEHHITPQEWAKEAWRESRLDILIPVAAGLAGGQFLMALMGLRSYHTLLLLICLAAAGYAALRTFSFLALLARNEKAGVETTLTSRDAQELFLPLLLSVVIYGIIAPNFIVSSIFAFVSLPHAGILYYLTSRYARVTATPPQDFARIPARVASFKSFALRAYLSALRAFRRTPDFTSH